MRCYKIIKKFSSNATLVRVTLLVLISTVFASILLSLLWNIIMPLIQYAFNIESIWDLKTVLIEKIPRGSSVNPRKEVAIKYGRFIGVIANVFIIAFSVLTGMNILNGINSKEKTPAR